MSYDGNGTYTQPEGTAALSNTTIESGKFNTLIADLALALSKCVLRDGQSQMLANLPMAGKKVTGSAEGTADQDLATVKQVRLATVAQALQLEGTQQTKTILGATIPMSIGSESVFSYGSFHCRAAGIGNENMAGMSFTADAKSIKLGLRSDGVFVLGGAGRGPYAFYSNNTNDLIVTGDVAAYSDPRLKEGFSLIVRPLEKVMKLNGMMFTWKRGIPHTESKGGAEDIGFMSDNVASVLPEAVKKSIDIAGDAYDVVAYHKIVPLIVEAMKEQQDMIEALREQVTQLLGQRT